MNTNLIVLLDLLSGRVAVVLNLLVGLSDCMGFLHSSTVVGIYIVKSSAS
jgi:hypothetical protein